MEKGQIQEITGKTTALINWSKNKKFSIDWVSLFCNWVAITLIVTKFRRRGRGMRGRNDYNIPNFYF